MSERLEIYAGVKVVGFVQDGIFRKNVRSSKHFLRKPPAIAMNIASLTMAEAAGALSVEVTDLDTGTVYTASVRDIWRYGYEIDRGHGVQVALSIPYWAAIQQDTE